MGSFVECKVSYCADNSWHERLDANGFLWSGTVGWLLSMVGCKEWKPVSELKNHSAEMGWLMAALNIPTHTPTLYFIPYCMTLCGYHQYGTLIAPYLVVQTVHHILWYKQYTILSCGTNSTPYYLVVQTVYHILWCGPLSRRMLYLCACVYSVPSLIWL